VTLQRPQLPGPVYRALLEATASALNDGHYSDKVLERVFKSQRKLGSRDRRAIAENLYTIVRHQRRLCVSAGVPWRPGSFTSSQIERLIAAVTPPPWTRDDFPPMSDFDWYSCSEDLWQMVQDELGPENALRFWSNSETPAPVFLRVNRLKATAIDVLSALKSEGIEALSVPETPLAVQLTERKNVFVTKAFKDGLFEVQDLGSQAIADFVGARPGDRVVDACAGAGGKTLALAAQMNNKGRIIAMDIHEWKLNELKIRARRAGVHIVETRLIEGSKSIKRLHEHADRVLLDVPCTGVGVLRRNPDAKTRLNRGELHRLIQLQEELLQSYSKMVIPGGDLYYSTCSVFPSENENQIKGFLSQNGTQWSLVQSVTRSVGEGGGDGFFMAHLRRSK
jgi:16S rRNA (cytosine967-C5)-methyltransferase